MFPAQHLDDEEKERLVKVFEKAIRNAYSVFGDQAFRPMKGGLAWVSDPSNPPKANEALRTTTVKCIYRGWMVNFASMAVILTLHYGIR